MKTRKYGTETSQQAISKRKPVLFCGAHDAGKTRSLRRLFEHEREIWGRQTSSQAIWLAHTLPLAAWVEQNPVREHWVNNGDGRPWSRLLSHERCDALLRFIQEQQPVVFVDDCDKLTGRKLQVAKDALMAARLWVASAAQENRINPSLRGLVIGSSPTILRMSTDVSYDATAVFVWFFAAVFAAAGAWEMALVLGGMRMFASGQRATKQI